MPPPPFRASPSKLSPITPKPHRPSPHSLPFCLRSNSPHAIAFPGTHHLHQHTLPSTMSSSVSSFCLPFCCRVPCSQPADACWNGCVIIEVMPARTASSACLVGRGRHLPFNEAPGWRRGYSVYTGARWRQLHITSSA